MTQYYETTITDDDTPCALHLFILPRRSINDELLSVVEAERGEPARAQRWIYATFDILYAEDMRSWGPWEHPLTTIYHAEHLATGITEFLWSEHGDAAFDQDRVRSQINEFADRVIAGVQIPFENSPLGGETLGKIVGVGRGALGAGIGLWAAHGMIPLLIITVPAGIIICGAANGIAAGLEKGLRKRISKLLRPRKRGK